MDAVDVSFDPPPQLTKQQKTAAGSSSHVRFDGVSVSPVQRITRKSVWSVKVSSKKELFKQLGQQFHALGKTCEDIAEGWD
jgi:hypothetical protein